MQEVMEAAEMPNLDHLLVDLITNKDCIAILLFLRRFNPDVIEKQLRPVVDDVEDLDNKLNRLVTAGLVNNRANKYTLTPYGLNVIDRLVAIKDKRI